MRLPARGACRYICEKPPYMALDTIIELNNARVAQRHNIILSDVSISINKGEFVYLIGRTGTGKSSLLRTLYGDLKLDEGEGSVVGFPLKKLKRRKIPKLRRKLGIVFQDFQLLTDRSVHANLDFVLRATRWKSKKEREARVTEVLEKVGLGTKGYKMPSELSGGEQQRVAIARALLNDPDLILADEPTGNLDPETSEEILGLLIDISRNGRAVLMATHDYAMMQKYPFRTIRCAEGGISEDLPGSNPNTPASQQPKANAQAPAPAPAPAAEVAPEPVPSSAPAEPEAPAETPPPPPAPAAPEANSDEPPLPPPPNIDDLPPGKSSTS